MENRLNKNILMMCAGLVCVGTFGAAEQVDSIGDATKKVTGETSLVTNLNLDTVATAAATYAADVTNASNKAALEKQIKEAVTVTQVNGIDNVVKAVKECYLTEDDLKKDDAPSVYRDDKLDKGLLKEAAVAKSSWWRFSNLYQGILSGTVFTTLGAIFALVLNTYVLSPSA